jgi:hypothetical protein
VRRFAAVNNNQRPPRPRSPAKPNPTPQDPLRLLAFNPPSIRDGYPRVHAFTESRDGVDLLVGIANGEGE